MRLLLTGDSIIASSVICRYYPQNAILVSPPAVDESRQTNRTNELVTTYTARMQKVAKQYHLRFINLYQAMINQGDLRAPVPRAT